MTNDQRIALWDAVNLYVAACGGDASKHVYGNTTRQRAVVEIERIIEDGRVDAVAAEREACANVARSWAADPKLNQAARTAGSGIATEILMRGAK